MNDYLKFGVVLLVIFLGWARFTLPSAADAETMRSSEVLGPEVHWRAPAQAQDLFKTWNFDEEAIGGLPP